MEISSQTFSHNELEAMHEEARKKMEAAQAQVWMMQDWMDSIRVEQIRITVEDQPKQTMLDPYLIRTLTPARVYRIWVNYENSGTWEDWTGSGGPVNREEALERTANIDHPTQILFEGIDPNY